MISITLFAYVLVLAVFITAIAAKSCQSRWIGIVQGIALQMLVTIPIAVLQLTGFVWKSWSIDIAEAIKVFALSMLFDMAGWTVITPFEWLVPKRQTWVFSNLSEFGMLWIIKVMLIAGIIAWLRERYQRFWNVPTIVIIILLAIDDCMTIDFPWWGT